MLDSLGKNFIMGYALGKSMFSCQFGNKDHPNSLIVKVMSVLFSLIFFLSIYIFILPFALLRLCVALALRLIHGKLYGGLLSGVDEAFEINEKKTMIKGVLIFSLNNDDEFLVAIEKMKKCLCHMHNSSFKFGSIIRKVFGYCYYLKDQVKFENIVDVTRYNNDEFMTKNMLYDYLERDCTTTEKDQMWRIVFFSQPIRWSEDYESHRKQHAMVWTFRHSLGDGPSIMSRFKRYIEEDTVDEKLDTQYINRTSKGNLNLDNVILKRNPLTSELDGTPLKIEGNTHWSISSFIERKTKYIPLIKKIKNKMNVTFSEVINAAIIASVVSYINQRNIKLKAFTMGTIIRVNSTDVEKIVNKTFDLERVENTFGILGTTLPVNLKARDLESIILYLYRYNDSLRHAVDSIVSSQILGSVCVYLPIQLIKLICMTFMKDMTIGITNLVGFRSSTWCGCKIDDLYCFVPDLFGAGFIFTLFSYGDRFQVHLVARRGFVHNGEELQTILDNVFKNIDTAEKEILLKQ